MKNSTPKSYVYAIRAIGTNRIKIGTAANPARRLSELQTGSPTRLELIVTWPGNYELEKKFHKELQQYRKQGEWFELAEWQLGWHASFILEEGITQRKKSQRTLRLSDSMATQKEACPVGADDDPRPRMAQVASG